MTLIDWYPRDPRYAVTTDGQVYGIRGPGPMRGDIKRQEGKPPYRRISLAGRHWRYVHDMVLETFVGPKPEGMCARHLNGDSLDNRLENLTYGTYSENNHDRVAHGGHPAANKTHCLRGHEFTPENTYIIPSTGSRQCQECRKLRGPASNAKRRAARRGLVTAQTNAVTTHQKVSKS